MPDQERLLHENAALVALLNTVDKKKGDTWTSIAEKVERQGSAIDVYMHELDPQHHQLNDDDEDSYDASSDGALFSEEDLPVTEERKRQLTLALSVANRQVLDWEREGLNFISVLDPRYPLRLREVVDMPPFLFEKGNFNEIDDSDKGVSIVGSRKASSEALSFAADVSSMLVERCMTVIAGLAAGVDSAAHRQALDEGGRTVAFIGTGITKSYPAKNRGLQEEIESRGQVFSQFWPWQGPTKWTFPARNASMSGYGVATVIVEAGEYSGTRVQARQAQHHGRPIILRDKVVEQTKWGNRLANRPNVYVASSVADVSHYVDAILQSDIKMENTIKKMIADATDDANQHRMK
ncbi:MAG: DNA-protecting protein DprA [Bifidobacteriales bacterium]|nr:DNA-protecting protein DprA [Bifidobacteriales bacterium]